MALNAITTQYIFPCLNEQSGWHSLMSNDSKMFWSLFSASSLDFCPQTRRCEQSSRRLTALSPQHQGCCHPPRHKPSGTETGRLPGFSPGIYWHSTRLRNLTFFQFFRKVMSFSPSSDSTFWSSAHFHTSLSFPSLGNNKQAVSTTRVKTSGSYVGEMVPSPVEARHLIYPQGFSLIHPSLPLDFPALVLLFSTVLGSFPYTRGSSTHPCWQYLALCLCAAITMTCRSKKKYQKYFYQSDEHTRYTVIVLCWDIHSKYYSSR